MAVGTRRPTTQTGGNMSSIHTESFSKYLVAEGSFRHTLFSDMIDGASLDMKHLRKSPWDIYKSPLLVYDKRHRRSQQEMSPVDVHVYWLLTED